MLARGTVARRANSSSHRHRVVGLHTVWKIYPFYIYVYRPVSSRRECIAECLTAWTRMHQACVVTAGQVWCVVCAQGAEAVQRRVATSGKTAWQWAGMAGV